MLFIPNVQLLPNIMERQGIP